MRIKLELPSPNAVLLISCVLVGASSAIYLLQYWFLPELGITRTRGGGLALAIAFFSVQGMDTLILGSMNNPVYAPLQLSITVWVSLTIFCPPALIIFGAFRKRLASVASVLMLSWLMFYSLLFWVLFQPESFP